MPTVALPKLGTAAAWRDAARALVSADTPPDDILWHYDGGAGDLFADGPAALPTPDPALRVPRAFVDLAGTVAWHADPERFALLYTLLWRLRGAPHLMADRADPLVGRLLAMQKSVHRDKHKMKAFLRFREIDAAAPPRRRFAAWFEPQHHIVEPLARGFFSDRFGDMDWIILTPDLTAISTAQSLSFADGGAKPPLPEDATEDLWTTYFRNIFNPARLKVKAMQAEMPKKYWRNMPEAAHIPAMIAGASARARAMQDAAPTLPPVRAARIAARHAKDDAMDLLSRMEGDMPEDRADFLRRLQGCTRCDLHANATQAVPGEGPHDAPLMVVGEQPGDQEDLQGRPFVGPAGQLFDRLADEAGFDRGGAYVTNAVKHFKFQPRGKRRIHQRPDMGEITACRWWLDIERQMIRPRLILAMGATAVGSLTGTGAGILKRRGTIEATEDGTPVFITLHPSYLLRVPDASAKEAAMQDFRSDLAAAQAHLEELLAA
ncbi:uracil-DNA glycosylase, putative [Oceaniovalibus guishaninsula JLT2003]|uniref:Type-4 uracil-DNA glycosylase n=1 Tax=Oceaniovalibus guishaninsula JLT2003 TaxID=1231392 RepID=K2HM96_9RHOB|nr:UdgX family uracil-DNA binding protein [Oceaniovalibus guishaninsula]EKE43999.1 uracil-DNA glycosylase, putative [Oceaniovalibus guishaninsula JLT2003]